MLFSHQQPVFYNVQGTSLKIICNCWLDFQEVPNGLFRKLQKDDFPSWPDWPHHDFLLQRTLSWSSGSRAGRGSIAGTPAWPWHSFLTPSGALMSGYAPHAAASGCGIWEGYVPLPDKRIITEQEIFKIFCQEGLFAMQKNRNPGYPRSCRSAWTGDSSLRASTSVLHPMQIRMDRGFLHLFKVLWRILFPYADNWWLSCRAMVQSERITFRADPVLIGSAFSSAQNMILSLRII